MEITTLHQQVSYSKSKNTNEYQQHLSNISKYHKNEKQACTLDLLAVL